jgi:hypothetical protein
MKRKILLTSRLPEVGKYVTTIDETGQEIVYRMNEDKSWNIHPDEESGYINRNGESAFKRFQSINNNYPLLFWIDDVVENNEGKSQFMLQYHLSRRSDEGWGNMKLVSAKNKEEAIEILIDKESYKYTDALSCAMVVPDNIRCLNIE